jgi:uncharacterized spore protein YtfJ
MSTEVPMRSMLESIRERASVQSAYGEPVVAGDRTIVPVARVAFGFGGGYGAGGERDESADDGGDEPTTAGDGEEVGAGEGGGLGGGMVVEPVGFVELDATGARLVRFGSRRRLLAAALVGLLVGVVLGTTRRRG